MRTTRLTPYSGSFFGLVLSCIAATGFLAALFMVWRNASLLRLGRSTGSFDSAVVANLGLSRGDERCLVQAAALAADQAEMAALAARQARHAQLRAFARKAETNYPLRQADLRTVATRKGALPGDVPERGGSDALARADAKTFDARFLAETIDAQTEAVDLFERAATQCEDPELRAFALKHLPTLRAELTEAKQLRQSID